jgi:hypothetical protein
VIAPALKALLDRLFDYAGTFPPAKLPLNDAISHYLQYRNGDYSWMLRSFVAASADLPEIPVDLNGALALLGNADEDRAASIETSSAFSGTRPIYCEVSPAHLAQLDALQATGCFAKIRTGGVTAEAIPSPNMVASFINGCAERKLAFKATAGLHHPIRSVQPLTYESNAPRATMHGFINILMASALAWTGERQIESVISETDPSAFRFDERAHWKNYSLTIEQIRSARLNFMHSIGSCSFEEPVQDLQSLQLF